MAPLEASPRRRTERGFTLIEVLVAFLIAALAIAAIVHVTTSATVLAREAGRYDEAIARAQSHLAELSAAPLVEGDRQGDDGDAYHWRVRIAAAGRVHTSGNPGAIPAGSVTLYRLSVVVSWTEDGRRHAVRLDSERLGQVVR